MNGHFPLRPRTVNVMDLEQYTPSASSDYTVRDANNLHILLLENPP